MNYKETIDFLFTQVPTFQRIGSGAYKPGLQNTIALDNIFGNAHRTFRTIHVAGTNGKGSVSHTIASILQKSGYRVGLYTSPHLLDFRERIRVNGEMIPEEKVVDFVSRYRTCGFDGVPSFFELSTIMAFDHFRSEKVDIAVIEVGLGGRLDCTNIISPILSIITNISFDHTQFLGNTLSEIASEKAGIIKPGIPVVIGEAEGEVRQVFADKATLEDSPIVFAEDDRQILAHSKENGNLRLKTRDFGIIVDELSGDCQLKNANTILSALPLLREAGLNISDQAIKEGFAHVCEISGLMGRWMTVGTNPMVICDTGHNTGGFAYISAQLHAVKCTALRIVIGFVSDKDVSHVLAMLPRDATYYFAQASVPRAMDCHTLATLAEKAGLTGRSFSTVAEAYDTAIKESATSDFVYVGGSTFIVADLLALLKSIGE